MDCDMISSHQNLLRFIAKLTRCLSLALLPALASESRALSAPQRKPLVHPSKNAPAAARNTPQSPSTPYLTALGSLPLRFARPHLERTDEPPAPPEPPPAPKISETAPDTHGKADSGPPADTSTPPIQTPDTPTELKQETPASSSEPPPTAPPLPILPDDTRRELRAEEILYFFRYPGTTPTAPGNATQVVIPVAPNQTPPTPPPPSSATYQLK
jgi:hypothetical protein